MPGLFDLIVIGGGCNGTGIARDAAMRGLKVLLLEKKDFSSGTTGASSGTKLTGTHQVVLCLSSSGTTRTCIAEETQTPSFEDGVLHTSMDLSSALSGLTADEYLYVTIDGTALPAVRMQASAYTLKAATCDALSSGNVTITGNLTVSGTVTATGAVSGSGSLTGVTAGTGLSGGGTSGAAEKFVCGIIRSRAMRKFFLFFDLLVLWAYRLIEEGVRDTVLITDRYFYDSLADVADMKGNAWLFIRLFLRLAPTPDAPVFVDVPAEKAFERKQEYAVEYMKWRRETYRRIFGWIRAPIIVRNDDLNATENALLRSVSERLGTSHG